MVASWDVRKDEAVKSAKASGGTTEVLLAMLLEEMQRLRTDIARLDMSGRYTITVEAD